MTTYTPPPEPGRTGSGRNRPVPFVVGSLLALVGFRLPLGRAEQRPRHESMG